VGRDALTAKVSLVTGASRGIGRAIALALARRGSRLVLVSRDEAKLKAVASEIQTTGSEATVLTADVSDQAQVNLTVEKALAHWGRLDILVSNAGEYIHSPLLDLKVDDFQRSMAVNFYPGIFFVQAILPHMLAEKRGHLVFITSVDGKKGLPLDAPYVAAKFALTGFAEVLRQELKGSGVYVSNVLPGRVDTEMIENLRVPRISAKISPETVADAVVYAIEKRKVEMIVPFNARALCYINAVWPELGDWVARVFHLQGWEEPAN
jgi:short-subunit dehydrogenase